MDTGTKRRLLESNSSATGQDHSENEAPKHSLLDSINKEIDENEVRQSVLQEQGQCLSKLRQKWQRRLAKRQAKAELGGLYIKAREAVNIRQILEAMSHPQPKTPIQTDNSTAEGVINNKVQPKRTKAMDMRFHWLRDRAAQRQFRFFWRPGKLNMGDYWTRHHPAAHHRNVCNEILTPVSRLLELRKKLSAGRAKLTELRHNQCLSARVC